MKSLIAILALVATTAAQESAFTPLFPNDGEPTEFVVRHWADISKPAQGNPRWEVNDGVLTSTGDRGCWLMSKKKYANFELEYEFKLGPCGNSGLALRAPMQGDPAFDGMEMQMADLRYNTEAKPSELTGGLYRALAPTKQVYKPEEWNQVRVQLVGSKIKIELNGELILDIDLSTQTELVKRHDGTDAPPLKDRPKDGHIGFQELSREGGHTIIRNARIRDLSKQ